MNQPATQPINSLIKSQVGPMASLTVKQNGVIRNTDHTPYPSDDITNMGHTTSVVPHTGKYKSSTLHPLVDTKQNHQYSPQPRRLFAMMTSVTASNTNWMLLVSVAQVTWE